MKPLTCELCGSNDVVKQDGYFVCQHCNTKYSVEEAKRMMVEGKVEVDGVATTESLLTRAEQFYQQGDYEKAKEYYNRVLDINPNNEDAKNGISNSSQQSLPQVGGYDVSVELYNEIERLLESNQKILAIKALKDYTGIGLAEAKAAVEALMHKMSGSGAYIKPTEKSGRCYIASTIYGSYDCPQVWIFRRYRDNTLANTWYGRLLINLYYAISPTVVRLFGNTIWFNNIFKRRLDKITSKLKDIGISDAPYSDNLDY